MLGHHARARAPLRVARRDHGTAANCRTVLFMYVNQRPPLAVQTRRTGPASRRQPPTGDGRAGPRASRSKEKRSGACTQPLRSSADLGHFARTSICRTLLKQRPVQLARVEPGRGGRRESAGRSRRRRGAESAFGLDVVRPRVRGRPRVPLPGRREGRPRCPALMSTQRTGCRRPPCAGSPGRASPSARSRSPVQARRGSP